MRGGGMYAGLALGFGIVTNLASCGYVMEGEQLLNADTSFVSSMVEFSQKQAARLSQLGNFKGSECRIPVKPVTIPESFSLVFDNEDVPEPVYSITVYASCDRNPEVFMRVNGTPQKVVLLPLVSGDQETAENRILFSNSENLPVDGSVELSENDYFKDSRGLIAGFRGQGTSQQRGDDKIPVQPTTLPEEVDGVGGPNGDLNDQVGPGNRHRPRPDFVIHIGESSYKTLGRIRVARSGGTWRWTEKYLELALPRTPSLKISCLSDRPRYITRLTHSAESDLVYRRRILNEQPDHGREEGPYQVIGVSGQSYQILRYRGPRRITPQRPEEIGQSYQPAITGQVSHSDNPLIRQRETGNLSRSRKSLARNDVRTDGRRKRGRFVELGSSDHGIH